MEKDLMLALKQGGYSFNAHESYRGYIILNCYLTFYSVAKPILKIFDALFVVTIYSENRLMWSHWVQEKLLTSTQWLL